MSPYSDFIERLFYIPGTLEKIFPSTPRDFDSVLRVRDVDVATLLGGRTVEDPSMLPLLRALLLYYFDALPEADSAIGDVTGDHAAYIRGMICRRSGDLENARQWYSRAGSHPTATEMHRAASARSSNMAKQFTWDSYMFTLMCEQYKFGANEDEAEIVFLQRVEFEHIFGYTWRQLTGTGKIVA